MVCESVTLSARQQLLLKFDIYMYKMYMVASWACEVTEILTQRSSEEALLCEDYSDLISPTSNQTPYIDIAVSVVYDTF